MPNFDIYVINLDKDKDRLQKFTKPEDLCYPTSENDKEKIVIIEHIETIEGQKEVLKLEFREGIKGILRRIYGKR